MSYYRHDLIKQKREEQGRSPIKFAAELGVTRQHYNRIERGVNSVSLPLLVTICEKLRIPLSDVLTSPLFSPETEHVT